MLQIHMPLHARQHGCICCVRRLRFFLNQLEYPPCACKGVLQFRHHAGNFIERLCILIGIA